MEDVTQRFKIEGMTCSSCAFHAEKALQKIDGVKAVYVGSWHKGHAELVSESGHVPISEIEQALAEAGYQYAEIDPNELEEPASSGSISALLLIVLMLIGFGLIAFVFLNNRQSLPLNIGNVDVNAQVSAEGSILPVISTNNAPDDMSFSSNGEAPVVNAVGEVHIPDPDKAVTVVLAGLAGCSTCGVEAQYLSNILDDYGSENLHIVFVDVYNWSGSDNLAWFANVLDATNLTWAVDTTATFRDTYAVDVDSTLIMNHEGNILYRDNFITEEATLREQIDLALQQSG